MTRKESPKYQPIYRIFPPSVADLLVFLLQQWILRSSAGVLDHSEFSYFVARCVRTQFACILAKTLWQRRWHEEQPTSSKPTWNLDRMKIMKYHFVCICELAYTASRKHQHVPLIQLCKFARSLSSWLDFGPLMWSTKCTRHQAFVLKVNLQ